MPKEGQVYQQLDLFTDYEALKKEQEKERRLQKSILDIKKKYGKKCSFARVKLRRRCNNKNKKWTDRRA